MPQRTRTISSMVWMAGHLRLISMARMAKSSTWIVAPDAYQKGPDTPYDQATLEDCSRVAAQVHLDTTSAAVRPAEMVRPAVLYTSELLPVCSDALTFLLEIYTIAETSAAKKQPGNNSEVYSTGGEEEELHRSCLRISASLRDE